MYNKPRVLYIDLSSEQANLIERHDLAGWLGGTGLATALLREDQVTEEVFSPEQKIVLAIGPMTGIYPVVTKAVAMFRSPLTGELGESHAGMRLGLALRFAGYDALVITGRAKRPVYLVVNSRGVTFKPAGPLWGLSTEETGRVLREKEGCPGHRSCIRIGPAAENLVRFAGVNVDTYRHFGRLGLGAAFGSKKLKAMVVQGDLTDWAIDKPREYSRVYQELYKQVTETDLLAKYHGLGTAGNVLVLNEVNALPAYNLQSSTFDGAKDICGEAFAEQDLIRKIACAGCPVGCIHLALYRRKFGNAQEYEFSQLAYDHELLYALGSMLGLSLRQDILRLIQLVEQAGLDAMSTGVVLAWATEAQEKGLISVRELGCRLKFGEVNGYIEAVGELVNQRTEGYRVLALGAEEAAKFYGGREFALTLGKNEVAGYHTGYANIVGQALGARHSHLDNAGYSLDQEKEQLPAEKLADRLILEEVERDVLTSLCICLFARKVYDFTVVEKALGAIGIATNVAQLYQLGRRIYLAKQDVKLRWGFRVDEINIPRRFFQTPSLNGMLEQGHVERLMHKYADRQEMLTQGTFPLPI